jgi:MFS family permease
VTQRRADPVRALGALFVGYSLLFLGTGALQQITIPLLKNTRPWSGDMLYWVMPTIYFAQAACRLPITHVIRRLGLGWSLRIGGLSYLLAGWAITMAPQYWMAIAGMVAWGIGSSAFWASGAAHLLQATREGRYGRYSGALFAAVDVGFIAGVPLLSLIAARAGYQWVAAFVLPASALGALVLWLVPVQEDEVKPASLSVIGRTLSQPWGRTAALLLFFAACSFGTTLGILAEQAGARSAGPVALLTCFYVARILTNIFGGRLSDRAGRGVVAGGAFALAAGGAALTAATRGATFALPLGSAALGMVFAAVPLTALALVGDHASEAERTTVYGSLFVWRDVGVASSMLLGHYLEKTLGGFAQAMWIFAGLWAVLAVFSLTLSRPPRTATS